MTLTMLLNSLLPNLVTSVAFSVIGIAVFVVGFFVMLAVLGFHQGSTPRGAAAQPAATAATAATVAAPAPAAPVVGR